MVGKIRAYLRWRWDLHVHWPTIRGLVHPGADIIEIGTWKGHSAVRWLKAGAGRLVCVDPYKAKNDASWEANQAACDLAQREARKRLSRGIRTRRVIMDDTPSPEASQDYRKGWPDLVYVDGDHAFLPCLADLEAWWPVLKPGGYMVIDDHLRGRWWGMDVINAVRSFQPKDQCDRRKVGRWFVIRKSWR